MADPPEEMDRLGQVREKKSAGGKLEEGRRKKREKRTTMNGWCDFFTTLYRKYTVSIEETAGPAVEEKAANLRYSLSGETELEGQREDLGRGKCLGAVEKLRRENKATEACPKGETRGKELSRKKKNGGNLRRMKIEMVGHCRIHWWLGGVDGRAGAP